MNVSKHRTFTGVTEIASYDMKFNIIKMHHLEHELTCFVAESLKPPELSSGIKMERN